MIPVLVTNADEAGAPKRRSLQTPGVQVRARRTSPWLLTPPCTRSLLSGCPPSLTPISIALQSLGADDGESRVLGQWMRSLSANGLLRNSSSSPVTRPAPTERSPEGGRPHDADVLVQSRRRPRHPRAYGWLSSDRGSQECGPRSLCLQPGDIPYSGDCL